MTNGTVQTGAIFFIYTVDFLILVCLKPFSNSIIQCFTSMTVSLVTEARKDDVPSEHA